MCVCVCGVCVCVCVCMCIVCSPSCACVFVCAEGPVGPTNEGLSTHMYVLKHGDGDRVEIAMARAGERGRERRREGCTDRLAG